MGASRTSRTNELRLPTMAIAVRLARVGGSAAEAELFASDVPHRGRGQLLDELAALVGSDDEFLPVRTGGAVQLLAKHAIAWIAVHRRDDFTDTPTVTTRPGDASEPPEELTLYDQQLLVDVELAAGDRLTGALLDSPPSDRSRAIDHLNRARRFLRLWTPDEHYLINLRQIVAVTELGELTELTELTAGEG